MSEAPTTIIAVGPRSEMLGLQSIGVGLVAVDDPQKMLEVVREQTDREEVCLILVSETLADDLEEEFDDLRGRKNTVIVLVPSHLGAKETTLEWMRKKMERTIGVDVLSE
ncbi:MAG: V-type ATP synthase subunit F [Planctomycetota bacterium]